MNKSCLLRFELCSAREFSTVQSPSPQLKPTTVYKASITNASHKKSQTCFREQKELGFYFVFCIIIIRFSRLVKLECNTKRERVREKNSVLLQDSELNIPSQICCINIDQHLPGDLEQRALPRIASVTGRHRKLSSVSASFDIVESSA